MRGEGGGDGLIVTIPIWAALLFFTDNNYDYIIVC